MTFIVRYCDNCTSKEVCLADEIMSEKIPTCRKIKDDTDPTGCGGLCEHGRQKCHRLGHGAYRYLYSDYFYKKIVILSQTTKLTFINALRSF